MTTCTHLAFVTYLDRRGPRPDEAAGAPTSAFPLCCTTSWARSGGGRIDSGRKQPCRSDKPRHMQPVPIGPVNRDAEIFAEVQRHVPRRAVEGVEHVGTRAIDLVHL